MFFLIGFNRFKIDLMPENDFFAKKKKLASASTISYINLDLGFRTIETLLFKILIRFCAENFSMFSQ